MSYPKRYSKLGDLSYIKSLKCLRRAALYAQLFLLLKKSDRNLSTDAIAKIY